MAKNFRWSLDDSTKIDSGPPARYQLQLRRVNLDKKSNEDSELRRFTHGICDHSQMNKTILLVGATGAGKTTLINALVNYVMGVEFVDKLWFEVISDERTALRVRPRLWKIVPYSLTIIDTPGYGHTEGIERDQKIIQLLEGLFCIPEGMDTINAVGLVMNSSDSKLDERKAYILNSVTSLFGKDMEQNIVIMMTHTGSGKPRNALKALEDAKIVCARDKKNEPVYFMFNNRQKEPIEGDSDEEAAEHAFKVSTKGIKKFTKFLETSKLQSLKTTLKVMKERTRLTACIQNLQERVVEVELKQMVITKNREELSQFKAEMEKNKEFTVNTQETYKEKETINAKWNNKAVTCNICEENCHYPGCTWALSPKMCEVMKKGECTSCTRKCPVDAHVKEKWKYVTKTRTVTKTSEEMKAEYEKNEGEKKSVLQNLEHEMSNLQQAKDKCLDEAFDLLEKLEKIALNVDSVSSSVHLEFLIQKMKEKGDEEKIQKLEEMRDRMSKKTKAAANYCRSRCEALFI
ncbi:hypothetical protein WMY93_021550 [Mugilogobius chulae]|uniref:AIG1-type G domain-containing protein n=1 Tax=Mugilogobius chulae TaxID=88201 RepID=A0AAW0NCA0_9GOBI